MSTRENIRLIARAPCVGGAGLEVSYDRQNNALHHKSYYQIFIGNAIHNFLGILYTIYHFALIKKME